MAHQRDSRLQPDKNSSNTPADNNPEVGEDQVQKAHGAGKNEINAEVERRKAEAEAMKKQMAQSPSRFASPSGVEQVDRKDNVQSAPQPESILWAYNLLLEIESLEPSKDNSNIPTLRRDFATNPIQLGNIIQKLQNISNNDIKILESKKRELEQKREELKLEKLKTLMDVESKKTSEDIRILYDVPIKTLDSSLETLEELLNKINHYKQIEAKNAASARPNPLEINSSINVDSNPQVQIAAESPQVSIPNGSRPGESHAVGLQSSINFFQEQKRNFSEQKLDMAKQPLFDSIKEFRTAISGKVKLAEKNNRLDPISDKYKEIDIILKNLKDKINKFHSSKDPNKFDAIVNKCTEAGDNIRKLQRNLSNKQHKKLDSEIDDLLDKLNNFKEDFRIYCGNKKAAYRY